MDWYEISEENLGKNEEIVLSFLKSDFQIFLQKETLRNISDQNVAELLHVIIVF